MELIYFLMDASNPVLINYGNDNLMATEAWYFLLQNTGKCFSLTEEYQKRNFFCLSSTELSTAIFTIFYSSLFGTIRNASYITGNPMAGNFNIFLFCGIKF